MAARGSKKSKSVVHEERIARLYHGIRSKSSGAAYHDNGDVRTETELIECKMTGGPGEKPIKLPKFVRDMEKATYEAIEENREPILALRYYGPESILADKDGWIDLAVRRAKDDACH